jgi:hypothetical protein
MVAIDLLDMAVLRLTLAPFQHHSPVGQEHKRLTKIYTDPGGFGTLLMITGKSWADRERRLGSMRLFMEEVAPQLRHLEPT